MELVYSQEECNNFKIYKKQLISLGFSSKKAKTVLKYIIKYYDNILIHKSIIFADIYYCYEYFFTYYYDDPFSKLVYKILNKWVNNDNHTQNYYSEYNYLYGKLSLFGDYTPWTRVYADIETVYIGKILSFYYHKKMDELEKDDALIFTEIIDNNEDTFCNKAHKNHFLRNIEELFRKRKNWVIFKTLCLENKYNSLPHELLDNIYKFIDL